MSRSSRILCVFLALIAGVALLGTWSQNIAYFRTSVPGFTLESLGQFMFDLKTSPASRSFSIDLSLFLLAAAVFMIVEARRIGIRYVGAYILVGFLVAISVTFPLFLIAREFQLARQRAGGEADKRLTGPDITGIAIVTIIVACLVWYFHR